MKPTTTFSCADCVLDRSESCADCLVTFICNRDPGDALVISAAEARAVKMLNSAGLVPTVKHVHRAG